MTTSTSSIPHGIRYADGDGDVLTVEAITRGYVNVAAHEREHGETAEVSLDMAQARVLRDQLTRLLNENAGQRPVETADAYGAIRYALAGGADPGVVMNGLTELGWTVTPGPELQATIDATTDPDDLLAEWERELLEADTSRPVTVTSDAEALQYGDREDDYGHPRDNMTRTAILWTALVQHKLADGEYLEPEDVARLHLAGKLSRDVHQPKRDNRVDMAGYALALDRLATGR